MVTPNAEHKMSFIVIEYLRAMREELSLHFEDPLPYGTEADGLAEQLLTAEIHDAEDIAALRLAEQHIRHSERDTVFADQVLARINDYLTRRDPANHRPRGSDRRPVLTVVPPSSSED